MKTMMELKEAVLAGKVIDVEFTERIELQEGYAQAGMRGRIIGVRDEDDTLLSFEVTLEPFDAHNDTLARSDFWDASGNACLTGKQAGHYPSDHKIRAWVDESDAIDDAFKILDAQQLALYSEFLAQKDDASYALWLEKELLRWRPK